MVKQIIAMLIFSIIVVLIFPYAHTAIQGLLWLHQEILSGLDYIFAHSVFATNIKQFIALLVIPFGAGLFVTSFCWIIKRQAYSFVLPMMWILWLIQTTALLSH